MAEPYTHSFELNVNNKFIKGDVEFNVDKKMTYNIKNSSDPFSNEMLGYFMEFMALLKKMYDFEGEIKLIKVKKNE